MSVSGCMFLFVQAHPSTPGQMAVKRLCVCFSEIWDLWAAGRTVPEDQAMTTVDKSTGNMDRICRVDTQRKHKET